MRLTPLILSVRRPTVEAVAPRESGAHEGSCRFCAAPIARPKEPSSFLDEDGACLICHLVRHLERPTIDGEARLIWLPELTQAALIALVREAHRRLADHGMLHLAGGGRSVASEDSVPPEAREALAAIAALRGRTEEAEARLGTSSPKALSAALQGVNAAAYEDRARLLGGVRLLPLGKVFEGGADVYRDFLIGIRRPS
jgi:hypothetical protein